MNAQSRTKPRRLSIKESMLRSMQSTGDLFTTVMDTISGVITAALHGAGGAGRSMLDAITEVAGDAVHATVEAQGDIAKAAKGIVVGVLRGTREMGDAALATISHTARIIIRQTAWAGEDVGPAAEGLVQGAILSAKVLGIDVARAATAAGRAAIEAAEEVGSASALRVRDVVDGTIAGTRAALKERSVHHASRR